MFVSSDSIFKMGKKEQLFVLALVQSYACNQTFKLLRNFVFLSFSPKNLKSLKVHPGTKLKLKQKENFHHDRTQQSHPYR